MRLAYYFLLLPSALFSTTREFRNMSEDTIVVDVKYQDGLHSQFIEGRGDSRYLSNTNTLDKITVKKLRGGVATEFEDHDNGNVAYWLDKNYAYPSQISISKR